MLEKRGLIFFQLLFIICGILGISPYLFRQNQLKTSSLFECIAVIVFFTKLVSIFFFINLPQENEINDYSNLENRVSQNIIAVLIVYCSIAITVTASVRIFKSRRRIVTSFNSVLEKIPHPIEDTTVWKNVYKLLKWMLPASVVFSVVGISEIIKFSDKQFSGSYFPFIIFLVHSSVLLDVYDYLNNIALRKKKTFASANRLNELLLLDEAAKDFMDEINSCMGLMNLFFILRIFFLILSFELQTFSKNSSTFGISAVNFLSDTFIFVVQCLMLVGVCDLVRSKAAKTITILDCIIMEHHNSTVRDWCNIFSLQLMHRPVNFSVCGFFNLDYTLLYSMTGAVTTYVISLNQLQAIYLEKGRHAYRNASANYTSDGCTQCCISFCNQ